MTWLLAISGVVHAVFAAATLAGFVDDVNAGRGGKALAGAVQGFALIALSITLFVEAFA